MVDSGRFVLEVQPWWWLVFRWRFHPGGASVVVNGVQFCAGSSALVEFLWHLMVIDFVLEVRP